MQVNVRHRPSFAVARLMLAPGEPAQVEAGAMVATSHGVHVQSQTRNPSALSAWVRLQVPSR